MACETTPSLAKIAKLLLSYNHRSIIIQTFTPIMWTLSHNRRSVLFHSANFGLGKFTQMIQLLVVWMIHALFREDSPLLLTTSLHWGLWDRAADDTKWNCTLDTLRQTRCLYCPRFWGASVDEMSFIQEWRICRPFISLSLSTCLESIKTALNYCQHNISEILDESILEDVKSVDAISRARRARHLGSERHSFPSAMAAFFCTSVLVASAAACRSSCSTISVPSRLLAIPSNSRQWAKHRAAFPDTVSSQLEPSKWRKSDSSVRQ